MGVVFSSRCLNYRIDVPDKIGSFLSSVAIPMVVKNGTKSYSTTNDKIIHISQPFEEL